jgi:hypothetical protein
MGLSRRIARLGKNEKRGATVGQTGRFAWFPERPHRRSQGKAASLPYRLRICARGSSIAVQRMRGPIGKPPMRRSTTSNAFSNGGFAYENDILEDTIL